MTVFYTSDEHYGHRNIITYCNRPFRDTEEMTEELVRRHNAVVSANDLVYHLGDFALDERLVEPTLKRLTGKHRLIVGNHDRCHPCRGGFKKARQRYIGYGFEDVLVRMSEPLFDAEHLPYAGSGDHVEKERYAEWRPKNRGRWLLHGHIHTLWKVRDRMINVGVDVWDYAPVTLDSLLAIIRD